MRLSYSFLFFDKAYVRNFLMWLIVVVLRDFWICLCFCKAYNVFTNFFLLQYVTTFFNWTMNFGYCSGFIIHFDFSHTITFLFDLIQNINSHSRFHSFWTATPGFQQSLSDSISWFSGHITFSICLAHDTVAHNLLGV